MRLASSRRGLRRPPCYFTVRLVLSLPLAPSTIFLVVFHYPHRLVCPQCRFQARTSPSGSFCPRAVSDFLTSQVCTCSPSGFSMSLSFIRTSLSLLVLRFGLPCSFSLSHYFSSSFPDSIQPYTSYHHPPTLPARNLFGYPLSSVEGNPQINAPDKPGVSLYTFVEIIFE